ncbi:MAG: hypothetical protein AAGN46_12745 [Acidobacteriota bacterium]
MKVSAMQRHPASGASAFSRTTSRRTHAVGWTRDPLGRATQSLLDSQFTQTSTFDTLSRRTQETQGAFTLDRVFDDVGRLASLEYPSTPSPVAYT